MEVVGLVVCAKGGEHEGTMELDLEQIISAAAPNHQGNLKKMAYTGTQPKSDKITLLKVNTPIQSKRNVHRSLSSSSH